MLTISPSHRRGCMRAHTATHILHSLLASIFPMTKQAGSYVGPDELRFDFYADRLLTNDELIMINNTMASIIAWWYTVQTDSMSYTDAVTQGAKAFFADTYPEIVRVVRIIWSDLPIHSVELCGGTHVPNTRDIGWCIVMGQSTVAAWIKRVHCITWARLVTHIQELTSRIETIATSLQSPTDHIEKKITKIQTEYTQLDTTKNKLLTHCVRHDMQSASPYTLWDIHIDRSIDISSYISYISLKEYIYILQSLMAWIWTSGSSWIIYDSTSWQYALSHPTAKTLAKELWLAWWGSDTLVQGKDTKFVQSP